MVEKLKAVLIDAENQEVRNIEIFTGLDAKYAAIKCSCVDCLSLSKDVDLWLDDEGFINGTRYGFKFGTKLLAGNALILNHNGKGDSISTHITAEIISPLITFWKKEEE